VPNKLFKRRLRGLEDNQIFNSARDDGDATARSSHRGLAQVLRSLGEGVLVGLAINRDAAPGVLRDIKL
jgi:hypothetical protein